MADESLDQRILQTYEKFYFFELDRREKLNARFSILIAIYSILLAGITSSLSNLPGGPLDWWLAIFYGFLIAQGSMLVLSLIYVVRFLVVETYAYVSHAKAIDGYMEELEKFNQSTSLDAKVEPGPAFTDYLGSQYCEAATNNFEENNVRYGNFTKALRYLIMAAMLALAGAIPYFAIKSETRSEVQKNVVVEHLTGA